MNQKIGFGTDTLLPESVMFEKLFIAKYAYDYSSFQENCHFRDTIPGDYTQVITIPSASAPQIKLFPNPATFECTISADVPFPPGSKAGVYDMAGRLVDEFGLSGCNTVISVIGFRAGIYQCRIITGDGQVVVKKLVVLK